MADEIQQVRTVLRQALSGRGAHVATPSIFDGLDWELAGKKPQGAPHSVFALLNHVVYWQDFALRWLAGEKPETPRHDADSWPGADRPADREEWELAVGRFKSGLAKLDARAREADLFEPLGPKTTVEILQVVAAHGSYHAGQVAALRRELGAWPPPGGGFTW